MADVIEKKIQICVFAYNLENTIEKSLLSLIDSCAEYKADIYVMINGCRDNTLNVVSTMAANHAEIKPIYIEMGDKANAWNTFVFQHYQQDSLAIFVDGDLYFEKNAVKNLISYYLQHPEYNAISSFPFEFGRSSKKWRQHLLKEHQFTGNLYLLSPSFLKELIHNKAKLPIGLIGDDSMLGYLSATNICSNTDLPKERIGVCQDAIFIYDSLNPLKWDHLKLYFRRRIRYSLRYFQQKSIVGSLKKNGISAMPLLAIEQTKIPFSEIRWFSSNLIFDSISKIIVDKERNNYQN